MRRCARRGARSRPAQARPRRLSLAHAGGGRGGKVVALARGRRDPVQGGGVGVDAGGGPAAAGLGRPGRPPSRLRQPRPARPLPPLARDDARRHSLRSLRQHRRDQPLRGNRHEARPLVPEHPASMKLVLARHGESEYSAQALLNGDPTVPCGLTALGVEQARALGVALANEPLGLCVTTGFQRVEATADLVLAGREVARLVLPGLADPRYGPFEGRPLADFRAWANHTSSAEGPGQGGESRRAIVERYARSFRLLLSRPGESILG